MSLVIRFPKRERRRRAPRAGLADFHRRRSSDARNDRSFPSDARRSDDSPRPGAPDPEIERRRRFRLGTLVLVLGLVFVTGALAAVFGASGWLDLRRSRQELVALQGEVERRSATVRALEERVRRLRTDPFATERIAREQLGMALPGEIVFLLPEEQVDPWKNLGEASNR